MLNPFLSAVVDNKGKEYSISSLQGKVVGVYFSAHWCPPCRQFTPLLIQVYNQLIRDNKPFEIIFVSSDRDQPSFNSYFGTMPWKAVAWGHMNIERIKQAFKVTGIPTLAFLDQKGQLITMNGKNIVAKDGYYGFPFGSTIPIQESGELSTSRKDALKSSVDRLWSLRVNDKVRPQAINTLKKIFLNAIKNPGVIKYRRLPIAKVNSKLLNCRGMETLLGHVGFLKTNDQRYYVLGELDAVSLSPSILSNLAYVLNSIKRNEKEYEEKLAVERSQEAEKLRREMEITAKAFRSKLESVTHQVLQYDDPFLQAKARSLIPQNVLVKRALESIQDSNPISELNGPIENTTIFRDFLLKELLHWFKHEFFQWVDQPPCRHCGAKTTAFGTIGPTPAESTSYAGIVELYKCTRGDICLEDGQLSGPTITRFPRYNHVGKLLDTKMGRCGEWAQAFTLCCRAIGFAARYVVDWTDHVWTEVWSENKKRWLHVDSCEKVIDTPLMYESGWNKKLNYIIAVSGEQVVDVIHRYTREWSEVQTRRTLLTEDMLQKMIEQFNSQRKFRIESSERLRIIEDRVKLEQEEFTKDKAETALKEEEKRGRQTGSVDWKLSRGEMGGREQKEDLKLSPLQKSFQVEDEKKASSSSFVGHDDSEKELYENISAKDLPEIKQVVNLITLQYQKLKSQTDWHVTGIISYSQEIEEEEEETEVKEEKKEEKKGKVVRTGGGAGVIWCVTVSLCQGEQCVLLKNIKVNLNTKKVIGLESDKEKISKQESSKIKAQEEAKIIFQRYLKQLNEGCGTQTCTNQWCRSSPSFALKTLTPTNAATLALTLVQKYQRQKFCPQWESEQEINDKEIYEDDQKKSPFTSSSSSSSTISTASNVVSLLSTTPRPRSTPFPSSIPSSRVSLPSTISTTTTTNSKPITSSSSPDYVFSPAVPISLTFEHHSSSSSTSSASTTITSSVPEDLNLSFSELSVNDTSSNSSSNGEFSFSSSGSNLEIKFGSDQKENEVEEDLDSQLPTSLNFEHSQQLRIRAEKIKTKRLQEQKHEQEKQIQAQQHEPIATTKKRKSSTQATPSSSTSASLSTTSSSSTSLQSLRAGPQRPVNSADSFNQVQNEVPPTTEANPNSSRIVYIIFAIAILFIILKELFTKFSTSSPTTPTASF